jgi:hypothetical protein
MSVQNAVPASSLLPRPPGAGLLDLAFEPELLAAEAQEAMAIVGELRAAWPGLDSWVNFPLLNSSGDPADLVLKPYAGTARPTGYVDRLPAVMAVASRLAGAGFDISYLRVAVLLGRDVLRPHVDMHQSIRLIIPVTEQGNDFRHVFDEVAVAMRTGEVWAVNGDICHGAANIADTGARIAILVDARPHSRPAGWMDDWRLPAGRAIDRPEWTAQVRRAWRERFGETERREGLPAAERDWQFASFEYALRPVDAYAELVSLLRERADESGGGREGAAWLERAEHWTRHNCVCVADEP